MTFHNFAFSRLNVDHPEPLNLIIVIAMLLCSSFLVKGINRWELFDYQQTNQLRGLAILLVILGHLWIHVADTRPRLIFGGDAVCLFLMISGYGLTTSYSDKAKSLGRFLVNRIRRVMVPYWLITLLLILLDYLFLRKIYGSRELIMTMLGVKLIQPRAILITFDGISHFFCSGMPHLLLP